MRKNDRQLLIKQLILDHDISTQEELLNYLKVEGVHATQATISRDIKELNLVKTPVTGGKTKYTLYQSNQTSKNKLEATITDRVTGITREEFIVILKTLKGNANAVSALIDDMSFPEVISTLAGHDTVVIFSHNAKEAEKIFDYLGEHASKSIMNY